MRRQDHLELKYKGLLTDSGEMDQTDAYNVLEGAKRFLASHATYYIDGVVPERLFSHSHDFDVRFGGTRSGSLIYDIFVNVSANAIYDLARLSFEAFLIYSFLTWREGRRLEEPEHARAQPVLEGRSANTPVFDFSPERELEREKLSERITQAMAQMTMPLGRSARTLDMRFNGKNIGHWDRRIRTWSEEDITAAVRSLQRQGPTLRTL